MAACITLVISLFLVAVCVLGQGSGGSSSWYSAASSFASYTGGGTDLNPYDYAVNNKQSLLTYLTNTNYDPFLAPKTLVMLKDTLYVYVSVTRISSFVQASSKFTVDMDIYVSWVDPLSFNTSVILQKEALDLRPNTTLTFDIFRPRQIWFPNLLFPKHRQVEKADESGVRSIESLDILFANGSDTKTPTFTFWRRVIGDVSCSIDYSAYPFDNHVCPIPILFSDFSGQLNVRARYVGPKGIIMLNTFVATTDFDGSYSDTSKRYSKGSASLVDEVTPGVLINVYLKRKSGTYAITQFLPMTIITFCGLSSLWVDLSAPPARVGLSITAVLSLVALSFSFTKDLPDTPYLTATSVYNITSLFFSFVTIPIFIILHVLKIFAVSAPNFFLLGSNPGSPELSMVDKPKAPELWQVVDKIVRVVIPLGYILFIVIFFPVASS
jgi:hypothetical protein